MSQNLSYTVKTVWGGFLLGEEKRNLRQHTIRMTDRERIEIGGVTDVLRFDEEGVAVDTTCGLLIIKGEGLHVGRLNLEEGEVAVEGRMDALTYAENMGGGKQSFFAKLFR